MGLFSFKKAADVSGSAHFADAEDVENARQYVDTMANAFRTSTDQQQIAIKRMASLSKTISKMESGLRQLDRVEADNNKLRNKSADLEKQLSQKTSWASEQENKLIALERQHRQTLKDLESAKADIAARSDRQAQDQAKLAAMKTELHGLMTQLSARDETVSTLEIKYKAAQDELSSRAADLSATNRKTLELQKNVEELSAKLEHRVKEGDTNLMELKELRIDYAELKNRYIEAGSALESARYDLNAQKTIFDETLKRRDEENYALKSKIDQMVTEVKIKTNAGTTADREIKALQESLDAAKSRADQADARLREKSIELAHNADALTKTKSEFDRLNTKFSTAIEDIDTLRKINQAQKEKLERYAAIGGVSAGQTYMNVDPVRQQMDERRVVEAGKSANVTRLKAVKKL